MDNLLVPARYPSRQKACDDKQMNATSVVRTLEETETTRRQIRTLLEKGPHTAKEISSAVHRSEKEVENHLEHLRKSLHSEGRQLDKVPAECRGCGFVFRKRDRLKAPSRCPVCKGEAISDPSFRVAGGQD
jgi:predicted Zn-ribbon and HTH transcriptional regulator